MGKKAIYVEGRHLWRRELSRERSFGFEWKSGCGCAVAVRDLTMGLNQQT